MGGEAKVLIEVFSEEELLFAINYAKEQKLPIVLLGRGSNVLLADGYHQACFIVNRLMGVTFLEDKIVVGAGVNMSYLSQICSKKGIGGFSFLVGIPGSVGGGVYMNAGIQDRSMKDVLLAVTALHINGAKRRFLVDELDLGYRKSWFHQAGGWFITSVECKSIKSLDIKEDQERILKKRLLTQPYKDPSLGSMFKNPPNDSAGRLIESAGLKGLRIGGAEVSLKHANFIVNRGGATAKDVSDLIKNVQAIVEEKSGIKLELEVIECFTTSTHIPPAPMAT